MQPHILVVDDDRNFRLIIRTNLELAGYDVTTASNGGEALRLVDEVHPDLIVLDVMMPTMDGLQVIQGIRKTSKHPDATIIALTAKSEIEDKIAALDCGADDYITKPFNPMELLARIRARLRFAALTERNPLTRLPGNRAIEDEISNRIMDDCAIIYADLDNFKAYNDRFGVARGDEAIALLARIVASKIKIDPRGFIGHVGGDDFIMVATEQKAIHISEEIIEEFDREVVFLYDEDSLRAGGITAHDRSGNLQRFPIMTLSLAVVRAKDSPSRDYVSITEAAAKVKARAKAITGSCWASAYATSKDAP